MIARATASETTSAISAATPAATSRDRHRLASKSRTISPTAFEPNLVVTEPTGCPATSTGLVRA